MSFRISVLNLDELLSILKLSFLLYFVIKEIVTFFVLKALDLIKEEQSYSSSSNPFQRPLKRFVCISPFWSHTVYEFKVAPRFPFILTMDNSSSCKNILAFYTKHHRADYHHCRPQYLNNTNCVWHLSYGTQSSSITIKHSV